MAENIVQSMFGPTPFQIQQAQQAQIGQAASNYAQLDPLQRAAQSMYQGGAGLGQLGAGMLGMVNPRVEEANQREAALSGIDINDPQSLLQRAQQIQDPRLKMQLQMLANQRQQELSSLALEAAKTRFQEAQATELPQMRHEEAMARLQQAAEAAKQRSEDYRLSVQQRADAAREANAARLQIAQLVASVKQSAQGQKLTKGQEAADREFGKEYAQYQAGGGSADVEKQLKQLEQVSTELGKPGNDYTGPAVGLISPKIRSITNPEAVAAQNKVEEVAQRNLRLVLGAQFTQVEGERLIARAYNPQMPPAENKARVDALIKQIRTAAKVKEDAARYFEENGTLTGWKGRMPTLSDFEDAIDSAKPSKTQTSAAMPKKWNAAKGKWE